MIKFLDFHHDGRQEDLPAAGGIQPAPWKLARPPLLSTSQKFAFGNLTKFLDFRRIRPGSDSPRPKMPYPTVLEFHYGTFLEEAVP